MSNEELLSYCRKCGDERYHNVLSEHAFPWSEPDVPVDGNDKWAVLQCAGCRTVTFCHAHWFSEDTDIDDEGRTIAIVHHDLYPPSPGRKTPNWGMHYFLAFTPQTNWVLELHKDVYAALAIKAYSLAAMGIRTLIDFVVTSKAGDFGTFPEKLERLRPLGLTKLQEEIAAAAFDAGSAAAHRGHKPKEGDVNLMLDVAEELLHQFYIGPSFENDRKRDADRLKANTPARTKPKKRG